MSDKKQLNVRLPDSALKQLEALREYTGMTQVQVLILALDKLHREKIKSK